MSKMATQIESIINAYKTLSKIPSVVSGRLNKTGNRVQSKWSVRNVEKLKTTKYYRHFMLDTSKDEINVVAESEFGADAGNEMLISVSPSEAFKAVIREERDGKDAKKHSLEIWSRVGLTQCIDLSALELHGDVYADSEFGSLDWSPDETCILYVAEKKLKKSEPYIKRKGEEKTENNENPDKLPKKGEEFLYRQDWGEQLVGKYMSVIVVCHLSTETFTMLQGLPESWAPGQVRFAPDGRSVVGVAQETEPRRLGLIFCTNRPSYIFQLTLDGAMTKISSEGMSVRSPRFSPTGELVWLQRQADGPHHACHELLIRRGDPNNISTLISIVEREVEIANGERFYGLYNQSLPNKCFSSDGRRLVFSTPQQNEGRSYVLDIESGTITDISRKDQPGSTVVLDVNGDTILAYYSNVTTPAQLMVAKLLSQNGQGIKWSRITDPVEVPPSLSTSSVEYLRLEHQNSQDAVKSFTAIYVSPCTEGKLPLIVWPHGGPHSGFVNAFALETAFFNMLGFATVQVNYRGSIGSGDEFVRFLPKRAGDIDVKDCKLATDEIVKKYPIDDKRICLFGGSHGGFLVTHLSGQYPSTYCAVVARNPVIDVASMFGTTDIADWCSVETGYEFTEVGAVSEEQLVGMRRCSPLVHVQAVRAPTALLLGGGDKRVPHFQGLEYARRLKANGVTTRVYFYDDNHSLSLPPVEVDNLINSADWLLTHTQS